MPSVRSNGKALFDDAQLLALSGSAAVLAEKPQDVPYDLPTTVISEEFDAAIWLADWLTSDPSGLTA
jgi:hypothetical protein